MPCTSGVMLFELVVLVAVLPSECAPFKKGHEIFLQRDGGANATHVEDNSVALPAFLAHMASDCQCQFKSQCSCEATLGFMNCISDACSSGKCECMDNAHFMWACGNMSATCPNVGLQCTPDGKAFCNLPPAAGGTAAPTKPTQPAQQPAPVAETTPTQKKQTWSEWLSINNLMVRLVALFVQLIPFLIAAAIYSCFRKKIPFNTDVPKEYSVMGSGKKPGFAHGLCSCFGDWKVCLLAYCCAPIRWADTMDKAKEQAATRSLKMFMGYWMAVVLFIVLWAFSPLLGGITSIILLVITTYMRQKLREHFNIDRGGITILEDCCTYAWCQCCAIAQEARQVESVSA